MGLTPVGEDWEWGRFPGDSGTPETEYWAAFQGEVLCRALIISPCTYEERELEERTTDNRTKILPRSGRGKPKYISLRDLERRPLGMHLRFWGNQRQMFLEHIPSQRTYYDAALDRDGVPWDLSGFLDWAARWEAETTQTDREELSALLQSKKKKFAYQEGDFFRFPMGRREMCIRDRPKGGTVHPVRQHPGQSGPEHHHRGREGPHRSPGHRQEDRPAHHPGAEG